MTKPGQPRWVGYHTYPPPAEAIFPKYEEVFVRDDKVVSAAEFYASPPSDQAADMAEATEHLREACRQLAYMDERSPSGTTPAVIARINHFLAKLKP